MIDQKFFERMEENSDLSSRSSLARDRWNSYISKQTPPHTLQGEKKKTNIAATSSFSRIVHILPSFFLAITTQVTTIFFSPKKKVMDAKT